jgi:hypothetical protein
VDAVVTRWTGVATLVSFFDTGNRIANSRSAPDRGPSNISSNRLLPHPHRDTRPF